MDGSRGVVEGSETIGHSANNRKRSNMYVKRNANNGRGANMRSSGKRVRTAAPHIELSNGGKVYLSSTSDYDPDAAHVYFVESNGVTHSDDVWDFGVNDLIGAVAEYVQQYVTLSDSDLDAIDQLVNNHYDNMFGAPGYGSYDKVFSNRKRVRAMRRRATGSPDEMGGGTNVVGPLKNDNRNLSDDLSLDAPLNDGADADNADYQPDKAREKAMEARRRRRAMRKRAATVSELLDRAVDRVNRGAPYDSDEEVFEAASDAAMDVAISYDDIFELVKYYCTDENRIFDLFLDAFTFDIEQALDVDELTGAGRWKEGGRANNRKRGNMYVKRNAGKNRRTKKASVRRASSGAAESLAEDIVTGGPYADEGELYDAIMRAVEISLMNSYNVWNIAKEYCSDGDIVELFEADYADDVYNEVYKHDMSELIEGDEGEVEARRSRARKAKKTRQSFRKRAQEADDEREDGDLPEFLEGGDGEDDDEDEPEGEPEDEEEPEDDEPAEEPEEDREARRAAVRKAMKAARGKVQKGARRVDEPEKNKPQMRQPVRVQRRSANVAGRPAATYDDTCLFM